MTKHGGKEAKEKYLEVKEDLKEEEEKADAEQKYKEAFQKSGGHKALKECKSISDTVRKEVFNKDYRTEIDRILPPSMDSKGASKFLVNQSYVSSLEELYDRVEEVYGKFGKAITEIVAQAPGDATAVVPPLKGKKRAMDEKGENIWIHRLTGVVRATLVWKSIIGYPEIRIIGIIRELMFSFVQEQNSNP